MGRELKVSSIERGTVIDHIRAGNALKVVRILGIEGSGATVSIVMNVSSGTMGRKDILKVEDRTLSREEVDKIALVAPGATINIIEDFEVVEKHGVELPGEIGTILGCPNEGCVTNSGEPVSPRFTVVGREPVRLRCVYCEEETEDVEENLL
ncbi:MAG: Aspartate carbamoyltransferase regulatory chain [Methanonatronarchaeales archaeon]|nr:Aspartate carbamoyltransferase regulatory chain [Methanonatronarchaeales archaeon]